MSKVKTVSNHQECIGKVSSTVSSQLEPENDDTVNDTENLSIQSILEEPSEQSSNVSIEGFSNTDKSDDHQRLGNILVDVRNLESSSLVHEPIWDKLAEHKKMWHCLCVI